MSDASWFVPALFSPEKSLPRFVDGVVPASRDSHRISPAVGCHRKIQVIALATVSRFQVGDFFLRRVEVCFAVAGAAVDLVDGFQAGRSAQSRHGDRSGALAVGVVHDGHARFDAVDEVSVVGAVEPVVVDLIHIGLAHQVVGGNQFTLQVPGQVGRVEELPVAASGT